MSSDTTPSHSTLPGQRKQTAGKISPFTSESRRACAVSTHHAVGELLGALTSAMEERGARRYLFGAHALVVYHRVAGPLPRRFRTLHLLQEERLLVDGVLRRVRLTRR